MAAAFCHLGNTAFVLKGRSPVLLGRAPDRSPKLRKGCRAQQSADKPLSTLPVERRHLMLTGAGLLAGVALPASPAQAEDKMIPVKYLSGQVKQQQLANFKDQATKVLKKVLTAQDATSAMRLLFNDAATFDIETGTGGVDGSVVLSSEEANRPENKPLKPYVDKLAKAKKEFDDAGAKYGQPPISWADMICLGAKVATTLAWLEEKVGRSSESPEKGKFIAENFAAPWNVPLGRTDSAEPAPAGRLLSPDASPAEVKEFMAKLGAKPASGLLPGKPPFWERPAFVIWCAAQPDPAAAEAKLATDPAFAEWKKKYDRSRKTTTRTDYEVDFVTFFTKLAGLGAKAIPEAYAFPIKLNVPERF